MPRKNEYWVISSLLIPAVALGAALALVPASVADQPTGPAGPLPSASEVPPPAKAANDERLVDRPTEDEIVRLFVKPRAETVLQAKASPPLVEPARAPWVSYIGTISNDVVVKYYFKDARSNRIIALAEGERNGEWLLVKKEDKEFILDINGMRYSVSSPQR